MEQMRYLISDAAKKVEVESHVLRYWEEELGIPIKRNELGHRYYTQEDVDRFRQIKNLKEQGLQLKAIRMILKDGKLERWEERQVAFNHGENKECKMHDVCTAVCVDMREKKDDAMGSNISSDHIVSEQEKHMIEIIGKRDIVESEEESKETKTVRLQMLLQHMISEAVRENNRELCEDIKQCVLKEIDYQFRQQDEKEEEREAERRQREEEHYKRIDEMLRTYNKRGHNRKNKAEIKREKGEKPFRFGLKKKPSVV